MSDALDLKANLSRLLGPALREWGFTEPELLEGVLSLLDGLKAFREEGRLFRPHVFVFREREASLFRDIDGLVQLFEISTASLDPVAFKTAVKSCAPLAVGAWNVFIKLRECPPSIAFGLIRRPNSLTEIAAEERFRSYTAGVPPFLLVRTLADDVVQIVGRSGKALELHFWANFRGNISADQNALLDTLTRDVPWESKRERTKPLLRAALHEAATAGHGFLVAVQPYPFQPHECVRERCDRCATEMRLRPKSAPGLGGDGTFFSDPLPVMLKVSAFLDSVADEMPTVPRDAIDSYAQLRAWKSLITQCLAADGIVLFDTCARLLGYRIFVRSTAAASDSEAFSGARKRAFHYLKSLVLDGDLAACFFQSQDGDTEFFSHDRAREAKDE